MWEIVEWNSDQFELFKLELNRVSSIFNKDDWSEKFVFEHRDMLGMVGFAPGLYKLLAKQINFLMDYHPLALKDTPDLKHWKFLHGDYLYFSFLQDKKEF